MTNSVSDYLFFANSGQYLILIRREEINIWAFHDPYPKLIIDGNFIGLSNNENIILTRWGNIIRAYELDSGNEVEVNPDQFDDYQRVTISTEFPNLLLINDILEPANNKTLKTREVLINDDHYPLLIPNSLVLIVKISWDVGGYEGESLDCLNIQTGDMVFTTYSSYDTKCRYLLSDGQKTLAIKDSNKIRVFNVETGKFPYEIAGNLIQHDENSNIIESPQHKFYDFALHPHKKDIVAILFEQEIRLVRVTQATHKPFVKDTYSLPGELLSSYKIDQPANSIIFSPDGSRIACVRTDKYWGCTLVVWKLREIQLDE